MSSLERRTRSLRAAGDPARAMVGDVSGARSPSGARGVAPSIRAGRSDADPNVDPLRVRTKSASGSVSVITPLGLLFPTVFPSQISPEKLA